MLKFIIENYQAIITAVVAILSGVIAISLLIPGEQPEKFLQWLVDVLSKFSVKKKSD